MSARKPLVWSGAVRWFPRALQAIAGVSKVCNAPDEPLTWDLHRSPHHADSLTRHLLQPYDVDPDTNALHLVHVAWRAVAWCELVQHALELQAVTLDELRSGNVDVVDLPDLIAAKLQRDPDAPQTRSRSTRA